MQRVPEPRLHRLGVQRPVRHSRRRGGHCLRGAGPGQARFKYRRIQMGSRDETHLLLDQRDPRGALGPRETDAQRVRVEGFRADRQSEFRLHLAGLPAGGHQQEIAGALQSQRHLARCQEGEVARNSDRLPVPALQPPHKAADQPLAIESGLHRGEQRNRASGSGMAHPNQFVRRLGVVSERRPIVFGAPDCMAKRPVPFFEPRRVASGARVSPDDKLLAPHFGFRSELREFHSITRH